MIRCQKIRDAASAALLKDGTGQIVYAVSFDNVPSRRTAEAVGYQERCRRLSYLLEAPAA